MQSARTMRGLFDRNRTSFFELVLPILRQESVSPGFNYLLTLLLSQGLLLRTLCNPEIFTFEEAARIARRLIQVDGQFDVRLLRALVQNNGNTSTKELEQIVGTATGIRLLDILGEISDGTRVLSTMAQLLNHPSSHIRSKAALLVGRSSKNHKWVQDRMGEPDARVRANAVESLWGSDTAGCRAVFWSALGDDDNRVVGNAALGLYRLGDPSSVGVILKLLTHTEAGFRVTGAWVMGETGDPRFMPILARIISEPVAELRGNAFRAMAKLKKAMTKRSAAAPLIVYLGSRRLSDDKYMQFIAAIRCAPGQQIPELNATNFAIWEDSALNRDYSVRQRGKNEPLAIALTMPRILDRRSAALGVQETAVERALRHKRRCDVWMVLKYLTPEAQKPLPQTSPAPTNGVLSPGDADLAAMRMRFTTDAEEILDAVSSPGTRLGCASDPLQAIRALTEATGQVRAARNIIFICQSPTDTFTPEVLQIVHSTEAANIAVHIVSCWPNSTMYELCSRTGGMLVTPSSPDEIPDVLETICASMLNSYEVRYQPENAAAAKLRLQVFTETLMGEGFLDLA